MSDLPRRICTNSMQMIVGRPLGLWEVESRIHYRFPCTMAVNVDRERRYWAASEAPKHHDAIEDTGFDAAALLRAWITPGAAAIVQEVTRLECSTYLEWIQSLASFGTISAIRVKLADNQDNSDPARVASILEGPQMLATRYQPAKALLEDTLQQRDANP